MPPHAPDADATRAVTAGTADTDRTDETAPAETLSAPDPDATRADAAARGAEDLARLGRYVVLGEIGRGGMGVVYRARDSAFGREVAVKILAEGLRGDAASVARFLEEARVTAGLQHPAIPPVHDIGEADGRQYLVMKLIRGNTLHELLAGRRDPSEDRAKFPGVFENLCRGVAYAHSRGGSFTAT